MPMVSYQSVSVNNQAELISELFNFATVNGWTVSGDVVGDGADCWAEIGQDGDDIYILGSRDQAMTVAGTEQSIINARTMLGVPWNPQGVLHLFAHDSPKALYACFNYSSDAYQWLSLGNLIKYGDYVGGTWYAATSKEYSGTDTEGVPYSDGVTRNRPGALLIGCDTAGTQGGRANGSWCYFDITYSEDDWGWTDSNGTDSPFGSGPYPRPKHGSHWRRDPVGAYSIINRGPNVWNDQTILHPLNVYMKRNLEGYCSLAGRAPGIRIARLDNYQREEVVTVGEQSYKLFPWFQRADGVNGSRYWGFAMELPE